MISSRPKLTSHSSVPVGRARLAENINRPSLPELLAAEGMEKPEYSTGYVQRVRQQYLALIASKNKEAPNSATPSPSNVKGPAPPPPCASTNSSFLAKIPKTKAVEKTGSFLDEVKLTPLTSFPSTNGITVRTACDSVDNEKNMPKHHIVSSLRAVFDKSPLVDTNNNQQTMKPTPVNFSKQPCQNEVIAPAIPVTPFVTHNLQRKDEREIAEKVSHISPPSKIEKPVVKTFSSYDKSEEPRNANENEKPKESEKPIVYGERVIIFKGRSYQTRKQEAEEKNKEQPLQDCVDNNQMVESSDCEDNEEKMEVTKPESNEFRYRIIGGSAKVNAKPMWFRSETRRVEKKIRFDDNIAVFDFSSWETTELIIQQRNNEFEQKATADLGLKPIEALTSSQLPSENVSPKCAPKFAPAFGRDAVDIVF